MALDIIIAGLINGSTYALLAIGFSLIFGVARIVNIAHTAFYMVASYCIFVIVQKLGYHPIVGMLVAVPLITLLGLICYKLFIDPIREHEAAVLIGTIALAIAIQEIMLLIFTGDYLSVPALVKGYFTIFDVKVFYQQLLTFVVALIILFKKNEDIKALVFDIDNNESRSDHIEQQIITKIFDSNLDPVQKMQFKELIYQMAEISNEADRVSRRVYIMSIKRRV